MQNLLFSQIPFEQLTETLSDNLFKRFEPFFIAPTTQPTPPPSFDLMTRKEAAKILGISLPTLQDWTLTGKITGYRIGTRIRYKRADLETSLHQIKTN